MWFLISSVFIMSHVIKMKTDKCFVILAFNAISQAFNSSLEFYSSIPSTAISIHCGESTACNTYINVSALIKISLNAIFVYRAVR